MDKILVIPDIHGRQFWKRYVNNYDKVVFLGDFHDPYPHEGIDTQMSLQNFREILQVANSRRDDVVMLYGNHDLSYVEGLNVRADRTDFRHEGALRALFEENRSLFCFAYHCIISGMDYLFSHAGIHPDWFNPIKNEQLESLTAAEVSCRMNEVSEYTVQPVLNQVGHVRGGEYKVGSCVWADLSEFKNSYPDTITHYFQVFGHSQLLYYDQEHYRYKPDSPVMMSNWACVDNHHCFEVSANGIAELPNAEPDEK